MESLRKKALKRAKKDVKLRLSREDRLIIRAIESFDELNKVFNSLIEQVRNWYSVYFPEANLKLKEHMTFLDFVINVTDRNAKRPEKYRLPSTSMGADLPKEDLAQIVSLAKVCMVLDGERKSIEGYVEGIMKKVCPNLTSLVGAGLGSRLISLAGSLERLATLPASTIQVLGAQKALFSHLTKGTLPPKHGAIFQYPKIRGAKKDRRGRIARVLSAKLAMAARADFFGRDISKKLISDLEKALSYGTG